MQTEAWEATRLKLAQLLSSKEFATKTSYYTNLLRLKVGQEPGHFLIDTDHGLFKLLHKKGEKVVEIITDHVPDITTDPITVGEVRSEYARMTNQKWPPEDDRRNTEEPP